SSFHSCTLSMSSPPGSSARTRAYEATLPGPTNQHRSGWSRRFVPSSGSPPSLVQPRKEPRRGVRIGGKPGGGWGAGLEPPAGGTGVRPDRTSAGRRLSPTGHPPLDVGAGPVPVGPFPGFVAGGGGGDRRAGRGRRFRPPVPLLRAERRPREAARPSLQVERRSHRGGYRTGIRTPAVR